MFQNTPLAAALPASDLERAKRWYKETLGLEPVTEDEYGGAVYETGGTSFLVFETPFAGTNQATAAGFNVDNFDEVIVDLQGQGSDLRGGRLRGDGKDRRRGHRGARRLDESRLVQGQRRKHPGGELDAGGLSPTAPGSSS